LIIKELHSFIRVRIFKTVNAKFKWPKKGKVNDERNRVLSLLSLEFKYRAAIVILLTELNEYDPKEAIPYISAITEN